MSVAAGGGMRHEDIAIALGISRDTLTKHYEAELSAVANLRRLEVLNALFAAAKRGSSSAAKAYLATEPMLAAPPAASEAEQASTAAAPVAAPAQEAKPAKLGKKEQADADASTAAVGTEWADLLRPATPLQ